MTFRSRAAAFAREELTPNAVKDFLRYKQRVKAEPSLKPAERRALLYSELKNIGRVAGAAAIYEATAATYGVSSRDMQMSFSAKEAWGNASPLSLTIASATAALIPPTWKDTVAAVVIPAELALSGVRIYVEQKVWKKLKITPDAAGTLLTPYLAGILEYAYKAMTTYPTDPDSRIMVGLTGIYGNCVRLFNAGAMYAVGVGILKAGKKDQEPEKA